MWALVLRSVVSRLLWLVAVGGAIAGAIEGGTGLYLASGAPQQAAAAANGCLWAIVPYIVARGFDELTRPHLR